MNNPFYEADVGTFTVKTYEVDGTNLYQIDDGSFTNVYTALPGEITENLAVVTDETETFATDVLYTLSFTPKHLIPRSGLLEITVPDQIEIENEVTTAENIWVVFGGEAE